MKLLAVLSGLAFCSGCQSQQKPAMSLRDQHQAALDSIADSCGLPRKTFQLIGVDQVQMQPAPDTDYKKIDCALAKLGKTNVLKLGFVGNEYPGNKQ